MPSPKHRSRKHLVAFLAALLAAICACGRPPERIGGKTVLVPVARFVDEATSPPWGALRFLVYDPWRQLGGAWPLRTKDLATATINDDTRYVLVAPPWAVDTIPIADLRVESDRRSLEFPLPESFSRSSLAVVRTAMRAGVRWSKPRPLGVFAVARGNDESLALAFSLPAAAIEAGSTHLYVEVFGAGEKLSVYETRPVVVPANARLRFATGMLPGTGTEAKVAFTIAACKAASCDEIFRDERQASGEEGAPWLDHSLSLGALAGQEVTLRFRADVIAGPLGALTFPVWSNPTIYAPAIRARPSVILISLDTLRADRLPTYGYRRDTAPFLDATFGGAGTVFEDCTSSAASTPPAHMTIMTSLEPSRHGVLRGTETIISGVATIAEVLRADGVTTGAVTENGWLIYGQGFGRGFESYRENRSVDVQNPRGEIDKTLAAASAWVSANGDSPFFLFVHTYQVHDPYTPPAAYQRLFAADGAEESDSDRYDQEIRFTDDKLRKFFAGLQESEALDDLVVVVTSDHGEAFLEHGYLQHSSSLHQEILRVPCLFWGAGIRQGARVKAHVGLIDFAPTIAGVMHAPLPWQFRGADLGPFLLGRAPRLEAELRDRVIISEAWGDILAGPNRSLTPVVAPGLSFRRGSLKVMRTESQDGFRYEAYDVAADPGERNDLSRSDGNAIIVGLRDRIDEYLSMARRNDATTADAVSRRVTTKQTDASDLAPDTENKLRALGYLE